MLGTSNAAHCAFFPCTAQAAKFVVATTKTLAHLKCETAVGLLWSSCTSGQNVVATPNKNACTLDVWNSGWVALIQEGNQKGHATLHWIMAGSSCSCWSANCALHNRSQACFTRALEGQLSSNDSTPFSRHKMDCCTSSFGSFTSSFSSSWCSSSWWSGCCWSSSSRWLPFSQSHRLQSHSDWSSNQWSSQESLLGLESEGPKSLEGGVSGCAI